MRRGPFGRCAPSGLITSHQNTGQSMEWDLREGTVAARFNLRTNDWMLPRFHYYSTSNELVFENEEWYYTMLLCCIKSLRKQANRSYRYFTLGSREVGSEVVRVECGILFDHSDTNRCILSVPGDFCTGPGCWLHCVLDEFQITRLFASDTQGHDTIFSNVPEVKGLGLSSFLSVSRLRERAVKHTLMYLITKFMENKNVVAAALTFGMSIQKYESVLTARNKDTSVIRLHQSRMADSLVTAAIALKRKGPLPAMVIREILDLSMRGFFAQTRLEVVNSSVMWRSAKLVVDQYRRPITLFYSLLKQLKEICAKRLKQAKPFRIPVPLSQCMSPDIEYYAKAIQRHTSTFERRSEERMKEALEQLSVFRKTHTALGGLSVPEFNLKPQFPRGDCTFFVKCFVESVLNRLDPINNPPPMAIASADDGHDDIATDTSAGAAREESIGAELQLSSGPCPPAKRCRLGRA